MGHFFVVFIFCNILFLVFLLFTVCSEDDSSEPFSPSDILIDVNEHTFLLLSKGHSQNHRKFTL